VRKVLTHCRTLDAVQTVLDGRMATENILRGIDDRIMVVVGCVSFASIYLLHYRS
jgi:3-deoxy-7-phosphoheptulonate synthase